QIRSLVLYPAELRARPVDEGRVVSSACVVRKGAGWAAIALILLEIEGWLAPGDATSPRALPVLPRYWSDAIRLARAAFRLTIETECFGLAPVCDSLHA
ncbi:MAG: hypothetical protein ACOYMK_16285, partial [Hyphomonadaceae bacterium]